MAILVLIFLVCTCIACIPTIKFIFYTLLIGGIFKWLFGNGNE
jgi:hypothetical protein